MNARFVLSIVALTLVLSACSNGGGGSNGAVTPAPAPTNPPGPVSPAPEVLGEFTYDFSFNGCSTGRQKFESKKAYCDALLDDSLNKSCARELRVEAYNRLCTGPQLTQVESLPAMSTSRCVVNGMDLKDRTFLDNLNPFNPQRLQNFRDIFWDGKREQAYNVMFSSNDSYGKARFVMTPASAPHPALGEIRVQQKKNQDLYSVRSGLGSQIRMIVTNYETEREVELVCRSDKAFRRSLTDLKRVKCNYRKGESNPVMREELISWDLQKSVATEMYRGRGKESLVVRLLPAGAGKEERIAVEVVEFGSGRALKAESTLNEGIEVRYQGKEAALSFALTCAAASK